MKQLIVDYLPFEVGPDQINEAMKENNGKLVVKGVLQRADTKNQNGRVYPREILMREAKKYSDGFVKEKRAMGELDHPESSVVNLQNVSHNITEMHWEGKNLIGTVEVLGTPSGNILKELFKAGIKLGISSREIGTLLKDNLQTSFKNYLNQIRLAEVKRLLKESDLPISDCAYRAGYNNISHFNRVFKNEIGVSPKQFREEK